MVEGRAKEVGEDIQEESGVRKRTVLWLNSKQSFSALNLDYDLLFSLWALEHLCICPSDVVII